MMFPKPPKKKKRKSHKKSILHDKDGTCYMCKLLENDARIHTYTEEHHIYGGPLRDVSEAEGFKVHLCVRHHREGPDAVHNNRENSELLKRICQEKYEKEHSRQQFVDLIGRNYISDGNYKF